MLFFNSEMDASSQSQNPNPNFDRAQQYDDDLLYFRDLSSYLMSDEDLEERVVSENKAISGNTAVGRDESSSSAPMARNIKCGQIVKKCKEKVEYRLAFRTKSNLEIMDDGFKWRKYGKKMVKSSPNPRNYFKCSNEGCSVKKRVERDRDDSRYVITTYEGVHNHEAPSCVLYCNPQSISL